MRSALPIMLLIFAASLASAASGDEYQLEGKLIMNDGEPFPAVTPVVFLHSVHSSFVAKTFVDRGGKFKFKKLPPGPYSLVVSVPRAGETSRTVDIGPSFADEDGNIKTEIKFLRRPQSTHKTVTMAELSIPDAARAEYRKAQDRLLKNDIEGATEQLKKALEIAPQFCEALNNLGTIAYRSGHYPEAESYFRQAREPNPDRYEPIINLGAALQVQGKLAEALECDLLAVEIRPDDALARSQLGQVYFLVGNYEKAEVELKKAKALDPRHFTYPQIVLADIYEKEQKMSMAASELREFLKYHPDSRLAPRIRSILQTYTRKSPQQ